MIWGEVVNAVRSLHLELLERYAIHPRVMSADVELTLDSFPFPDAADSYDEWNPPAIPERIQEALEFHPVERALLEGPLLPIQVVKWNASNGKTVLQAILKLEEEWFQKSNLHDKEKMSFVAQSLQSKFMSFDKPVKRAALRIV